MVWRMYMLCNIYDITYVNISQKHMCMSVHTEPVCASQVEVESVLRGTTYAMRYAHVSELFLFLHICIC